MLTVTKKKYTLLRCWFRMCPARHCLIVIFGLLIGLYFLLRSNRSLMEAVAQFFVAPWHRAAGKLCSALPFSIGELLIVLGFIAAAAYIVFQAVGFIRHPDKLKRLYRLIMSAVTVFCVVYGGFCLLWGVYYYTSDFEEQSGIHSRLISTEELETVTRYFTVLLSDYAPQVQRDESGVFAEDVEEIFSRSDTLYDAVSLKLPCLSGQNLKPKPFFFSEALSYMTFTGFFFPFTGEANINVSVPACSIPATIAHELAHQRGVAQEDRANFVAVLSCLENGDPVYCYSACLMAYTYLGNALYSADYEAWLQNYENLHPLAIADMRYENSYWAPYRDTVVNSASDAVYTGFLQSYGQTEGLKTYGKCVDLLVAYYYEEAAEYLSKVE